MKFPDISFKEIAVAWITSRNPSEQEIEIARHRAEICAFCVHKQYRNVRKIFVCDLCGCPLNKKIFSPRGAEACPAKLWEK